MKYLLIVVSFVLGVLLAIPLLPFVSQHVPVGPDAMIGEGEAKGFQQTRVGPWKFYQNKNGEKGTLACEGEYQEGKQHGRWVYYFKDGTKEAEGDFDMGVKTGRWTSYYEELDRKKDEGEYQKGKEHGSWTFWYPNGKEKCHGNFHRGEQIGEWQYFNREGNPIEVIDYGVPEVTNADIDL